MTIPTYLPYSVIGGCFAVIAAILFGFHRALSRIGGFPDSHNRIMQSFTAVIIGWFIAALALALSGAYHATADRIPTIQYGLFVPIIAGMLLLYRSSTVRRLLDAIPQHWLIGIQVFRILGVTFLVLHASGMLPGLFAWPAGLGDILVGVLAPAVAFAYARAPRENRTLVYAWNILGLADLAVAVGMGLMTSPSPLQLFAFDHPNELISIFPLVLIPTFLVPLSVLLHLASLFKLAVESQVKRGVEKPWIHLPG